jgi:hypothetical protein
MIANKRGASRATKASASKKAMPASAAGTCAPPAAPPNGGAVLSTKPELAKLLEAAILERLAQKERLNFWRLAFSTRWRLERKKVMVSQAAAERAVKALAARGLIEIINSRGKPVCVLADTKETRVVVMARAKRAKKRAAARAKSTPLPKTRCYVLSELEPLYPKLASAIRARFAVEDEQLSAIEFRWKHRMGHGPLFRVEPSSRAEVRRAMGGGRYSYRDAKRFASFAFLSFSDLDEVLDETNGLIEAQRVLANAAKGPLYNAWNHGWIEL